MEIWTEDIFKFHIIALGCSCIFPSDWGGSWFSSEFGDGEIVIDAISILSGWNITSFHSWTCQNSSGNILLFQWVHLYWNSHILWKLHTEDIYQVSYTALIFALINVNCNHLVLTMHFLTDVLWMFTNYGNPPPPHNIKEYQSRQCTCIYIICS